MLDIQDQLAELRRRIARIDRKFTTPRQAPAPAPPTDRAPARYFVENWLQGSEVTTPLGTHFETERVWERHRRHGSVDISQLCELTPAHLAAIASPEYRECSPERWAFLDTETTGLAGGAGTYAFLIGVGRITSRGFHVRQFFMRDYAEEPSLLHALTEHLSEFDVLVTYNGKTYDQPLLETRYTMARARPPFTRMHHVDLLSSARRLWKLRFDSCRLVQLENRVLGVEREGDVPGELIPYLYFEYLRMREAFRLAPIFHHNAIDILTLACFTAVVPLAFSDPEGSALTHGAEMVGVGRWLLQAERREEALALFRRAVDLDLTDALLFRTLWDIASIEKRLGHEDAVMAVLTDLAASKNPYRAAALGELAKYYEHKERNYSMALEMTRSALAIEDTPEMRRRETRLEKRLAKSGGRRRLMPVVDT